MIDITGDILSPICDERYTLICHQVNCKGVMGAGLAKQIRIHYPSVYKDYKELCAAAEMMRENNNTKSPLLGTSQFCEISSTSSIVNLFAQDRFGRNGVYTDYESLRMALRGVRSDLLNNHPGGVVRIPYKIGCGLGGGDWDTVKKIIRETLCDNDVPVEVWKLDKDALMWMSTGI